MKISTKRISVYTLESTYQTYVYLYRFENEYFIIIDLVRLIGTALFIFEINLIEHLNLFCNIKNIAMNIMNQILSVDGVFKLSTLFDQYSGIF